MAYGTKSYAVSGFRLATRIEVTVFGVVAGEVDPVLPRPSTYYASVPIPFLNYMFDFFELFAFKVTPILQVFLVALLGLRMLGFICDVAAGLLWLCTHYSPL